MDRPRKKPTKIKIDAKISDSGIDVFVNLDKFSLVYPKDIWSRYNGHLKEVLKDNVAFSATLFLPQMLDCGEITYATARPLAESYLLENGLYDMPSCAIGDKKSSISYILKFFNSQYHFADEEIKRPDSISMKKRIGEKTAIVPFSFGKESLLNFALCRELGIEPILVHFIEPWSPHEYHHKKKLIREFENEFKTTIHTVTYGPGYFKYGRYWNLNTELGWGLHVTEYCIVLAPFVSHFNADTIVLGNERSCNDTFVDTEGVRVYKAGYDQCKYWTGQQGMLSSLITGQRVDVVSFVEPIYELAETRILHHRYPDIGKYQMSCFVDDERGHENRWCERCVKCGYMFALIAAFGFDYKKIGFRQNLFEKKYASLYDHFFGYDPKAPEYGSQEELGLAFYLATLNGATGASIDRFKKELFPLFKKSKNRLMEEYLGIHPTQNIPPELKPALFAIYHEELKKITNT